MGNRNWRNDRPTDEQRRKLFAMGKNGDRPMTKGEASDLINGGGRRSYSSSGVGGGLGCMIMIVPIALTTFAGAGYFPYTILFV